MTQLPDPPQPRQVVLGIAARLAAEHFGTGPLAELRRLDPGKSLAVPGLQRLLAEFVPENWNQRDWGLIAHLLAFGAPDGLRTDKRFGAALHAAGYSESRLARLLAATRDDLTVVLPRAVRFLVAHGEGLPVADLAYFVRAATLGGSTLEGARTEIARHFYRAERATASGPSSAEAA